MWCCRRCERPARGHKAVGRAFHRLMLLTISHATVISTQKVQLPEYTHVLTALPPFCVTGLPPLQSMVLVHSH